MPAAVIILSVSVALISTTVLLTGTRRLPVWESLVAAAVAGYVILSYGFANFTVPGTAIPLGHVMAVIALILAVQSNMRRVRTWLREPSAFWWLVLLGLSIPHLMIDLPRYGAEAVRDASFVFEGVFAVLGFLWATRTSNLRPTIVAFAVLFLLNAAYALTFPYAAELTDLSPVSGIFQPVPLFGYYPNMQLFLPAGALFYLLVAKHIGWPRAVLLTLALFQFAWSLVFQSRSEYLAVLAALLIMGLIGRVRQSSRLAVLLGSGVVIFFVTIGILGAQIRGRIGGVDPDFLWGHFTSIFLVPDTPEVGSAQWRLSLLPGLRARFTESQAGMLFGEGFGQPLIDFHDEGPLPVRQPHNTHLSVVLRLGTVGFVVWLLMLWSILTSLIRAVRNFRQDTLAHDLMLWLLVVYVLVIVVTTLQPALEFSYSAIPFYTFMGFALGISRRSPAVVTEAEDGETTRSSVYPSLGGGFPGPRNWIPIPPARAIGTAPALNPQPADFPHGGD